MCSMLVQPFLLLRDPAIDSFKMLQQKAQKRASKTFPVYVQSPGTFRDVPLLTQVANRVNFDFLDEAISETNMAQSCLGFCSQTHSSIYESNLVSSQKQIHQSQFSKKKASKESRTQQSSAEKEGFFSMFTKTFKKSSKELKLGWKKDSFLCDVSSEMHQIVNRNIHFFEKKSMLAKIFNSLISFFPETRSDKSEASSGEGFKSKFFLSSKNLFSTFFREVGEQLFGTIDQNKLAKSTPANSPSSMSFASKKAQNKSKIFRKFDEKDTRTRNQQSMNNYQQALGTLLFSFQGSLVFHFQGHYRLVKEAFSAKGQFSLFGPRRNLLTTFIKHSMKKSYPERLSLNPRSFHSVNNLHGPGAPSHGKSTSTPNLAFHESIVLDAETQNGQRTVYPAFKQDKATTSSFQRPFVKMKIDFSKSRGLEHFPYLDLLSIKGRQHLSKQFESEFFILKRINSYLKAFFEMDRFSEVSVRSKLGKTSARSRRKMVVYQKLPFSSVLYHVKFRGLEHFSCYVVRRFYSMPALVILEKNRVTLVLSDLLRKRKAHLELKKVNFKLTKGMAKTYTLSHIRRILEYKFLHCSNACQLLFKNNRSEILHFDSKEALQTFLKRISYKRPWLKSKLPSCRDELKRQNLKNLWAYSNSISNFDFLSQLNLLGSRSLDDFSQYPVFPLVLTGFDETSVEARDLKLPVGMIGDECKVSLLSQKYVKSDNFHDIPPYFYGSHYSSPATTFHFLLRLKPFEKGAKTIQNGRFDLPDRLFHSFANVLDNIKKETSDVREFPPELYYQPLFLLNLNNLDFGVNQSSERVDHVITPSILGECPFRFVYSLREKLESASVSKTLSHWVDLIFGVHQKGESAVAHNNIFFYLTYQNSRKNILEASEKDREALETQVFHFGQIPLQVTQSVWPQKRFVDLSIVSSKYTKKYFVKKVFEERLEGLTSTCAFCYEKISSKRTKMSKAGQSQVPLCETCYLCGECSSLRDESPESEACVFCAEYKKKDQFSWKTTGAPHENSILLIKEESFIDLNRKYVSKISIIRPFRVDFYTFILFKSEKQINLFGDKSSSKDQESPDAQHSASKKPEPGKDEPKPAPGKTPKPGKESPFELNLNKSISLEKLQFQMKNWDLIGIPGGLWTLKEAFDLFKDKLLLGGCPQGFFRMFNIRKSKCQLTKKLHEHCISRVLVSKSGSIMTQDVSGIIKMSIIEEKFSKPHLTNLLTMYRTFDLPLQFLSFSADQGQFLFYVLPFEDCYRFQVFDSSNNAKLLIDFDILRESHKVPTHTFKPIKKKTELEYINLSFGFLNSIVSVQTLRSANQYFLSTYSFEGVPLTQFTLALESDNNLQGFKLFKDSFFKDYLVSISQKG